MTQFSFGQKPSIGIKAGLAFSNATINSTDRAANFKHITRTGILGGVYLNVPSGESVIFRPGVEIVPKGGYIYPLKFTFLDFPVNILYKINFPKRHLIAGGGPVIGVPINAGYSEYPLKTEFSLNGLVGYGIPIGFSLNLNYTYGISNANKDNQFINKISNRYLGLTAGYTF